MKNKKKSKHIWWMPLAEILVLFAAFFYYGITMYDDIWTNLFYYLWDPEALIGLLIIIVSGMLISCQGKDFILSFTVGIKKHSLMQLKNISEAVTSFQRYVCLAAVIQIAVQVIITCHIMYVSAGDTISFFPNLAVVTITAVYAAILELIIIPIKSNVVRMINEELDFDDEQPDTN